MWVFFGAERGFLVGIVGGMWQSWGGKGSVRGAIMS